MIVFRDRWLHNAFVYALCVVHFCVPTAHGFYTHQRQRYASRMLKITPRECHSPDNPKVVGICMISLECQQRAGTVIGACRDGHLFGACCHDPVGEALKSSTVPEEITTTTTTTTDPTSSAATSSQQENNEVIPIDSQAQLDSQTAIPSLIDTFSELSPTFLSDLALDDHTTGRYSSHLPVVDDDHEQAALLWRQKIEEEEGVTSAANAISTEFYKQPELGYGENGGKTTFPQFTPTTERNARTSTSTEKYYGLGSSAIGQLNVIDTETGGLGGVGSMDDEFKDNMIKYIDEIVTLRNPDTSVIGPDMVKIEVAPVPEVAKLIAPEEKVTIYPTSPSGPAEVTESRVSEKIPKPEEIDMPFSTFTIVSSDKPAINGDEIISISTTGSGDTMLPSTTTPVPVPEQDEPVSVKEAIAELPSSTENSVVKEVTENSVSPSTESVQPTKFTFSKLKYSPRPYKPRSTTEKTIWTRPTQSTLAPFQDRPLVDMEDDNDNDEEEEDEENNVRPSSKQVSSTSASYQVNSVEQTTVPSSTEGAESDTTSPNQSSYINDENVEEHGYNGGDTSTQDYTYYSDPSTSTYSYYPSSPSAHMEVTESHQPSTYPSPPTSALTYTSPYAIPYQSSSYGPSSSSLPYSSSYAAPVSSYAPPTPTASSTVSFVPVSVSSPYVPPSSTYSSSPATTFYTPPPTSSPAPTSSSPFNFDWTTPTLLSLIKGASELYASVVNASERSDFLSGFASTTENEVDSSLSSSTESSSSSSSLPSTWKTVDRTTSIRSTEGVPSSPRPTQAGNVESSSSWDTSIDSFVDQVVEGIVLDLNKSNKIDDMIFNNSNHHFHKKTTTTTTTVAPSTTKRGSTTVKPSSKERTKAQKKSSSKSKTKATTTTPATTPKPKKTKPTTKVTPKETDASKRKTNKNKAKPVKKVTTSLKPSNSTRKRLDYRKDCGVRPLIKRGRIVGGTPSKFGSWPWHALVKETVWWGIFSKIKCGGVLISAQHVLTAAHCQPQQTGTLSVVLGVTDSDDSDTRAVTKTVKRVIPHPQFNARTYENDIAILELESPVDFQPHVVPICLPKDDDVLEGKTAFVTGMGLLKHDGERPLVLQEVDLPIVNNSECQKMFVRSGNMKPIIDSFICAGYEQGRKDSCGGDSGGPLSVKRASGQWVLAGTVSHGIKCALPDQPGVYMRTSYYKPWIDRVLNMSRSRFRGMQRCNAPPMICARQRQQVRHHQPRQETGIVHTLFRIFRLARKMVDDGRKG